MCQIDKWQIHIFFCLSVSSEAHVNSGDVHSLCTSESMGQTLPTQIRGVQHLGHWIPRSVVRQVAARTEPNPRYRRIGPFSEVPYVRGMDGRLYQHHLFAMSQHALNNKISRLLCDSLIPFRNHFVKSIHPYARSLCAHLKNKSLRAHGFQ